MRNKIKVYVLLIFFMSLIILFSCDFLQELLEENLDPTTTTELLAFSEIRANSLSVNWNKDYYGSQPAQEYLLVYSDAGNINTVEEALQNGEIVMDWTKNTSSASVFELQEDSTYFFNVIVRDSLGSRQAYKMTAQSTEKPSNETAKLANNLRDDVYTFGEYVDISYDGLTIVAHMNQPFHGAVFKKKASGWIATDYMLCENRFKHIPAISGDASVIVFGLPSWRDEDEWMMPGAVEVNVPTVTRPDDRYMQTNLLTTADTQDDADFGDCVAVSMDGSVIVIGAPDANDWPGPDSGAVYVFEHTSGSGAYRAWTESQCLVASAGSNSWRFGIETAISADGSVIAVGTMQFTEEDEKVFIFTRQGDIWIETDILILESIDDTYSTAFGRSISVSDDGSIIVVGAYNDNCDEESKFNGSAYVYERQGSSWSLKDKLVPMDAEAGDYFGYDLDISGDGSIIVVGAPEKWDTITLTSNGPGSAYLFVRQGSAWLQADKLLPLDPNNSAQGEKVNDCFGSSVAITGDGSVIVIGAHQHEEDGNESHGAVYVFE